MASSSAGDDAAISPREEKDRRDKAREKLRVNAGQLDQLERLILFSPLVSNNEDNWTIVEVSKLQEVPRGVVAGRKMSRDDRVQPRDMAYKGSPYKWRSCVFARVEKGEERILSGH